MMGLFDKQNEKMAEATYDKDIKKYLKERNGKTHVLLIESFANLTAFSITADDKYTTQINNILDHMQSDGYEIIDIKINSSEHEGALGNQAVFTLVTYK